MKFEKMQEIFENVIIENLNNCCDNNVREVFEYLADLGFSRKEAFDFIDKNYLDEINWQDEDEPEANEKVNTETGEGVFWKEYTEDEDAETQTEEVNVGGSDQAILETALTQIGIPYTWEGSRNGDGGWIDLKITDNGDLTGNTAAEIYFTKEGKFNGTY